MLKVLKLWVELQLQQLDIKGSLKAWREGGVVGEERTQDLDSFTKEETE